MTFRVYGDRISGNCYKVKLALEQLGEHYEWVDVDVVRKETRTPEFLAKNRFDLAAYPAVRAWLERVRAEPRHVPIG